MRRTIIQAFCLSLALLASNGLQARAKTDIITLENGDQVTGEIKSMFAGLLRLSTNYMGTLEIEWARIADIESNYNFEVRSTDGLRRYGSVDGSERNLILRDIYGEERLEWLTVVELRPVKKTLDDALGVYFSATVNYTKASDVATATFATDVKYENEHSRNSMNARTSYTRTGAKDDGVVSTSSRRLDLNRRAFLTERKLFRNLSGVYESNDELALDYRYSVGAGAGRYLIENHRMQLVASVGAQVITEKDFSSTQQESLEGALNLEFSVWRFDSPELDLRIQTNVYPSLTESGRVRGDLDMRLRWELYSDLYWDFSGWITYDNQSNNATDNTTDYALTTGIGWTF